MFEFNTKYKPTNQKKLFHRKCLQPFKIYLENNSIVNVYGNKGSGKTSFINLIIKNYNVIQLYENDISSISVYNISITKRKKVIFIDNIDFFLDDIDKFLNYSFKQKLPIILCSLNKYNNKLKDIKYIHIEDPSNLDLNKLLNEINLNESLELSDTQIKSIIKASDYDLNKLYNILELWVMHPVHFDDFIENYIKKDYDKDLYTKMDYIYNKDMSYKSMYKTINSDSYNISLLFYSNYINIFLKNKDLKSLDTISAISNTLSETNTILNNRENYDKYTDNIVTNSVMLTSHTLKHNNYKFILSNKKDLCSPPLMSSYKKLLSESQIIPTKPLFNFYDNFLYIVIYLLENNDYDAISKLIYSYKIYDQKLYDIKLFKNLLNLHNLTHKKIKIHAHIEKLLIQKLKKLEELDNKNIKIDIYNFHSVNLSDLWNIKN